MKRKALDAFINWKNSHSNKPLMVLGARQVGKTYSLMEFCKDNYEQFVYINLEMDEDIYKVFETTIDPSDIINAISILKGIVIDYSKSVIFFDEIQVSERAIQSLKYFCEAEENYHIVCAGSMLGVALNRFKSSFPVGKVYRYYMHPMDFEEYLWGIGEIPLSELIRKHFLADTQLLDPIHRKSLDLFKNFLYTGGMPASINEFIRCNKNMSLYDNEIKQSILEDYLADMSKYTTNTEHQKINKLYKSIPKQLGQVNTKFNYKLVDEKANKRSYERSIEWLCNSFIAVKCTLVEFPELPMKVYEKDNFFKIYLNDIGLLTTIANIDKKDIYSDELKIFSGMLAENYVANSFCSKGIKLHYWKSKHNAEIDFLINIEGHIIPVEVKASTNTKAKSLKVYQDRYDPYYSIRISGKNFGFVNGIKSVPLYAVHLIK